MANRAADWLQRQWRIAGSYEASRTDIELTASEQLAAGDMPILIRIVQKLDREEAGKLTQLAAAVQHHRRWESNIDSAADAVHRAFLAEAHDLRADIADAPKLGLTGPYAESPYSAHTEILVERAGEQVQSLVHARHLKVPKVHPVSLSSAHSDIDDLKRVTEQPVDVRLAVLHGSQLDVWDLRTGRVRRNVIPTLPVDAPNALSGVGTTLLAQFDGNWQLWPTSGPRAISLPTESPNSFYQADGAGGMWRTDAGRIRRYDTTGHPIGPWRRYPTGLEVDPLGATKAAIASNLGALDFNEPHAVLWYPDSGRIVAFNNPCFGTYHVAQRILAFISCDQAGIHLLDTATGRTHTVHLPRGLMMDGSEPVLAPDGSKLAVVAGPRRGDVEATSLYVMDLKTAAVTNLHTAAAPITWSADGSVLLLNINGDGVSPTSQPPSANAPLAYWKPGMSAPAGIRINLANDVFSLVALP